MLKYFDGVERENLKRVYKKLARELHPDLNGGSDEAFKELQAEYEKVSSSNYKGQNQEAPQNLSEALKKALKTVSAIEGLEVELVGKWIWVSGLTYPVKDLLKENGFKFSGSRKKWYFSETQGKTKGSKARFEDLRKKYGAEKVQKRTHKKIN